MILTKSNDWLNWKLILLFSFVLDCLMFPTTILCQLSFSLPFQWAASQPAYFPTNKCNGMLSWPNRKRKKKHGINIVIGIRNKAPKEKVRSRSQSIQFPISWPATEHSDPRNHRITSIKPLFSSLSFKEKSINLEWGYYKDRALAKIGGQKKPR